MIGVFIFRLLPDLTVVKLEYRFAIKAIELRNNRAVAHEIRLIYRILRRCFD